MGNLCILGNSEVIIHVVSGILISTGNVETFLSNFLGRYEKKIRMILAAAAFFNMKCDDWSYIDFPNLEKSKFYFPFLKIENSVMRGSKDSEIWYHWKGELL